MDNTQVVVDSSIIIEHLRKKNKSNSQLSRLPELTLVCVSSVTVYELMIGATIPQKRMDAEELLEGMSVLSFDEKVSMVASEIFHSLRRRNLIIEFRDIFIAATALAFGLPIKTLNVKHFSRIEGLELL